MSKKTAKSDKTSTTAQSSITHTTKSSIVHENLFRSNFLVSTSNQPISKLLRKSTMPAPTLSHHNGFECNGCQQEPIVGKRFVCNICADYDLCEGCYNLGGHEHRSFEVVVQSKSEIRREWCSLRPMVRGGAFQGSRPTRCGLC